jgi:hypothetical protein
MENRFEMSVASVAQGMEDLSQRVLANRCS